MLVLLIPVALGAGAFGNAWGRGRLERLAADSPGTRSTDLAQQIGVGALVHGLIFGLTAFVLVLMRWVLLQPTRTTGRRVAKVIQVVFSLALLVAAGLGWLWLVPQFVDMVQGR